MKDKNAQNSYRQEGGTKQHPKIVWTRFGHSCTRVRGPPVTLHVSHYTSRSRFPQNPGVFQVYQQHRATPPPPPLKKKALSHLSAVLQLLGVSHVKLPLKRCCATGGCSSYTCRCRARLCRYGFRRSRNTKSQNKLKASSPGHRHSDKACSILVV